MNNIDEIFYCECENSVVVFKTLIDVMWQILNIEQVYENNANKNIKHVCFRITNNGIEIYSDACDFINSNVFFTTTKNLQNFFFTKIFIKTMKNLIIKMTTNHTMIFVLEYL